MWHLIKAEFEYHKYIIFLISIFFIITVTAFFIDGVEKLEFSFPALKAVMMAATVILWLVIFIRKQKEKPECYYAKLPVSFHFISIFRSLTVPIFWLVFFVLFWMGFIIFRIEYIQIDLFYNLLSMTGFILMINAFPLIHRDLTNYFSGKFQKLVLTGIYGFFMLIVYFMFVVFIAVLRSVKHLDSIVALKIYLENFSFTLTGSIVFFSFGLVLTLISIVTFNYRKLYLD